MLQIPRCYDKNLSSNKINEDRLFIGLLGKDWVGREVLQEMWARYSLSFSNSSLVLLPTQMRFSPILYLAFVCDIAWPLC